MRSCFPLALGHAHSYVNNVNDQGTNNVLNTQTAADNADINQTTSSSTTDITINSTRGGGAHNTMPPLHGIELYHQNLNS